MLSRINITALLIFLSFFLQITSTIIVFGKDDEIVLNKIVAGVNEDCITLMDMEITARWNGRDFNLMTAEEKHKLLNQLINRVLILQEVNRTSTIYLDERVIQEGIKSIKGRLEEESFSDEQVKDYVVSQLLISEFSYQRFSPLVKITGEMIDNYYRDTIVKEAQLQNQDAPPLSELREQIEKILTGREINRHMEEWLAKQREISRIIINNF